MSMRETTSSFFRAVESGDIDQVERLLTEHPALAHARDGDGSTGLHQAAFFGHRAIVRLLHERGADLNARDPIHDATPTGWAIHYLREMGGLLAIEIDDVLYAIETRDAALATRFVRRHPALVSAVDAHGKPLAEHARASGVPEISALFEPSNA